MISTAEALSIIRANRPMPDVVDTPLEDCVGAVCAQDVPAKVTMPPFDASAMDGYGVRFEDARKAGRTLTVIGEAPAGSPFEGIVREGQAVRIFTGSPMPGGTDHVVIQENVTRTGDDILLTTDAETPRHIRKSGIDFTKGDILVAKDARINPAHIALAASGNHASLPIYRRPRVAILASGDELRSVGSDLKPGQIINSNMAALKALITHWGGVPIDLGIARDNLESIAACIKKAEDADIIVPIGGASVGDYDFMKEAFSIAGFETLFKKIAVRPGKPTWLARKDGQCVLGLPGNPASAMVCAHLFLKPLLGAADAQTSRAKLDASVTANGPRETYMRARIHIDNTGALTVTPFPKQDSSLITPFVRSNALIKLPPNSGPWQSGDSIDILPLEVGPDIL